MVVHDDVLFARFGSGSLPVIVAVFLMVPVVAESTLTRIVIVAVAPLARPPRPIVTTLPETL